MSLHVSRIGGAALVALWAAVGLGQQINVSPEKPDGIYAPGAKIVWKIEAKGQNVDKLSNVKYALKKNAFTIVREGQVDLTTGAAQVSGELNEPGSLLLELKAKPEEKKEITALGGAIVEPEKIQPDAPRPDDFDAFWDAKLKDLSAIPANPKLEEVNVGNDKIEYYKIQMDNIRGSHIQGQLARPKGPGKHPAMLIVQWAGVYGLDKNWITGRAQEGWLVLDIEAHDLPIDRPGEFYKQQSDGPLKDYPAIGNDDRETSYFLRMYLSCYRAAEYLTTREDWDGKNLVVTGGSQGGLQSVVTAALHPKITAVVAAVPAGCDMLGPAYGRLPGWPMWYWQAKGKDANKVHEASRYYDVVNFASRVKCPTMIGVGLIDTTCAAPGVISAFNQIQAPKQLVILPVAGHMDENHSHQPYYVASNTFLQNILNNSDYTLPVK